MCQQQTDSAGWQQSYDTCRMAPESGKKKVPDCCRMDRAVTGSVKSMSIITVLSLIMETVRWFFIFFVSCNKSVEFYVFLVYRDSDKEWVWEGGGIDLHATMTIKIKEQAENTKYTKVVVVAFGLFFFFLKIVASAFAVYEMSLSGSLGLCKCKTF